MNKIHEDLNPYKYEFDNKEIEAMGKELADLIHQKKKLEEQKSAILLDMNSKIKDIIEIVENTAKLIKNGFEMREPQQGEIVFKDGSSPEEGLTESEADRLAEAE